MMMDKMYIHGVITITVFTNTHVKENHKVHFNLQEKY